MSNFFLQYPEFIDTDVRTERPNSGSGYTISYEYQENRHKVLLPPEIVAGKRVLDLGSCVSATGAWVLAHGAIKYVGVEIQHQFCQLSKSNLEKYFDNNRWEIYQDSIDNFFKNNKEQFDIVVAFGVIYHSIHLEHTLDQLVSVNPDIIVIDASLPYSITQTRELKKEHPYICDNLLTDAAIVEYRDSGMISENKGKFYQLFSADPSPAALEILFQARGWRLLDDLTADLYKLSPNQIKNNRYCVSFGKEDNSSDTSLYSFESVYNSKRKEDLEKSFKYSPSLVVNGNDPWKFDTTVAKAFKQHAIQHIPDYNRVILLSVELCRYLLTNLDIKIIDVGCAIGATLTALNLGGCTNLVGVDSSQPMLDQVPNGIAELICSSKFPASQGPYGAVLCNWTLHFIQDKNTYLQDIFSSMLPGGFLVLTDKTANSGIELELYHLFKRSQHVSESEIEAKAKSVKDIMFINNPQWYLDTLLSIGFKDIKIVNAAPCFTTFLAFKH